MCFSAEASFGSAAVLAPLGIYCLRASARMPRGYWAFAIIPLVFAVQQFAEGLVWLGLNQKDGPLATGAAGVYLFFALAFWPTWFAIAAACIETRPHRRWLLTGLALLSTAWFWFAYLPAVVVPSRLDAEVAHHSIHYRYGDDELFGGPAGWLRSGLYALCTGGPLLVVSWRRFLAPVMLGLVCVAVAAWFFHHAYTSVWCFFAALLSAYCACYFARSSNST